MSALAATMKVLASDMRALNQRFDASVHELTADMHMVKDLFRALEHSTKTNFAELDKKYGNAPASGQQSCSRAVVYEGPYTSYFRCYYGSKGLSNFAFAPPGFTPGTSGARCVMSPRTR
jgi:hypothetical protein